MNAVTNEIAISLEHQIVPTSQSPKLMAELNIPLWTSLTFIELIIYLPIKDQTQDSMFQLPT